MIGGADLGEASNDSDPIRAVGVWMSIRMKASRERAKRVPHGIGSRVRVEAQRDERAVSGRRSTTADMVCRAFTARPAIARSGATVQELSRPQRNGLGGQRRTASDMKPNLRVGNTE